MSTKTKQGNSYVSICKCGCNKIFSRRNNQKFFNADHRIRYYNNKSAEATELKIKTNPKNFQKGRIMVFAKEIHKEGKTTWPQSLKIAAQEIREQKYRNAIITSYKSIPIKQIPIKQQIINLLRNDDGLSLSQQKSIVAIIVYSYELMQNTIHIDKIKKLLNP
jgi:hypothetical protein